MSRDFCNFLLHCINLCGILKLKEVIPTKERLKELRNALNLSQQEFSERINVAQSTYAHFETGRREIRDIHISRICSEFHVSEHWFRTGEGKMFEESSDSLISQLCEKYKLDSMARVLLETFVSMPQAERDAVMSFAQRVVDAANRGAAEQENEELRNNPVFSEPMEEAGNDNTEARA